MRSGGPRIETADLTLFGLQYGVVTQNKDDDQQLDRIKVRLPWLDNGDSDQTYWAQLLTPMEGKNFGIYTLPDINDVVAVLFINGDTSQPVVIGGVWSTPDFSPETNEDGKNNFRGYRSRKGHRLILDDSSKVKVTFSDKTAKNMVGIGAFDQDGAGPNVCAIYKPPMAGDGGVSISSMEGQLNISCTNGTLSVTAQQNIKINAKTTIDIRATGALSVEGSSAIKLTSGSPCSCDASTINIA
jgi:uncharacterized protein involved in type VI secretion and phage assembly